ncbi:MAG: B12-binding domain-containing radical SAM protein [Candidatus Omnitrophota bacterium]|nr:MAG: B12-binding domain-containing radical SAM protein [Candidatus Omnitrophota bacterium]
MRVCLVRTPFFKLLGIKKVHFPLSIGYLASYLEKGGHNVSFVDGEAIDYNLYRGLLYRSPINEIVVYADPYFIQRKINVVTKIMQDRNANVWNILIKKISETKPDVVGISCYTVDMTAASVLAGRIKKDLGNIPVVLGGIHPTSDPQGTLEGIEGADYVVVGEGEESFLALINNIDKKGRLDFPVKGILARGRNYFEPRPLIEDLDSIPFPRRDFYDKSNYIFGAALLTSRGCVFECTFCASHLTWTRKVRYRSVANVIEELKVLKAKFDVKRIRILDDTFVLNKKWILEFCDALKKNNLKFTFNCSGRINTVDEELLRVLSGSGFDSIAFGVESGSPRIIHSIKKNIDVSRVTDIIKMANRFKFDTTSFYMTGHPGETLEDIRMSEELFKKSMSKRGELSMLIPYLKTGVGNEAEKKGFKFKIKDCYKFFHARNRVLFNMTKLSDREFLAEHRRFEKIIKRRNYKTAFKKLLKLALKYCL